MKPSNVITLYNRTETGDIQVWIIRADEKTCTIHREWGMLTGRRVSTSETMTAKKGRPAAKRMLERVQALVQDRIEKGWRADQREIRTTTSLKHTDMKFDTLPMSFAPQKPVQEPPLHNAALEKSVGKYLFQRKRDGQRHYVLKTADGEIRIFSRRMEEKTQHLPRIRRALERCDIPRGSVLDGELIVDIDGDDNFRATGQICRAGASRAAAAEATLPVMFMLFDVLFLKRQPIYELPYRRRWEYVQEIVESEQGLNNLIALPEHYTRFATARTAALDNQWEGLVIWDLDAPNELRMNGKHVRAGCYKWKPVQTGDFVATGWLPGNGRLAKTMGKLIIAEWQPWTFPKDRVIAGIQKGTRMGDKLVEIGRVGSGFDDETRDAIAAGKWKFPCVVELEYDKQEEDSRALRFPVFIRKHPDKTVEELR